MRSGRDCISGSSMKKDEWVRWRTSVHLKAVPVNKPHIVPRRTSTSFLSSAGVNSCHTAMSWSRECCRLRAVTMLGSCAAGGAACMIQRYMVCTHDWSLADSVMVCEDVQGAGKNERSASTEDGDERTPNTSAERACAGAPLSAPGPRARDRSSKTPACACERACARSQSEPR